MKIIFPHPFEHIKNVENYERKLFSFENLDTQSFEMSTSLTSSGNKI